MLQQLLPILAQATGTQQQGSGNSPGGSSIWIGMFLMIGVFYFVLYRGKSKEQKSRQNLLDNLKKNDRVMTIGGIIGTVAAVKDNEVVVKVDESTNTKMTFIKKSIQQVITEGDISTINR